MENNAINVNGTLDASAPNNGDGGFIETSAAKVSIADDAVITTYAPNGKIGEWLIDPTDYNIAASGGNITGTTLGTNLGTTNVTILSSDGTTGTSGDVNVNDAVSWSANTSLTLSAYRNVNVNSNITATGNTAGLVLTPDTCGGACTGTYSLNNGAVITLSGTTPSLTIAGNAYTVLNSLGAQGSTTGTDLQGMSGNLSGYYALGSNIDATATSGWNSGAGFLPVGDFTTKFTGTFDGLGHTITGLTINRPTTNYVGLFGYTDGATISNVGLVGGSVTGKNDVGGLAGYNNNGTITNSYATGNVSGNDDVGGLAGYNFGTITNSYSTGAVNGSSDNVGGLVGYNNGTITNSYSTANVTGSGYGVGGLAGQNSGTITNSYSTGTVSGTGDVGGLAGGNYATISNSYSTGMVTGSNFVGGLVGYNNGTITNSYWDTTSSGQPTSDGGTGLTTVQMMQQANFTGFDFTNNWWMSEGNTRPFLRMEYSTNITNAHQLQLMGMNATTLAASYTLAADINMAELSQASGLWNTATGFLPLGDSVFQFIGAFDGLGHTITGLTINRPTTDYVGLFGYTNGAAIRNIGLVGGSVSGSFDVGGLVGYNFGTITNSYSTGSVTGSSYVGGLVGFNFGTITTSYSTGSVNGSGDYVGGLAGYNGWTISNSYATGAVTGSTYYVGGLAGYNYDTITNSYSTGMVTGTNTVGGLAGYNFGIITDSYYNTQTTGQSDTGKGTPKTTAEMKQQASFSGWDFTNTWRIYEGNTYPLLKYFLTPLTVTANNASKTYDGLAYSGGNGVTYSIASPTLSGALAYSGTSQGAVNAGSYAITPGGFYSNQQGYDITFTNGALTVNPAALTITADNKSKTYGDANPALTATYTGLKGTDTSSVVSGLNLATTATTGSNVGSYTITAADGAASNYTITYNNGVLTITAPSPSAASSTVSASAQTTASSASTILDMYQIMDTENITDIKNFNDTIASAGTPNAELWTAKAVNYEIEQTVFGYQPPKGDSLSIEDEDKKIERQNREQKIK